MSEPNPSAQWGAPPLPDRATSPSAPATGWGSPQLPSAPLPVAPAHPAPYQAQPAAPAYAYAQPQYAPPMVITRSAGPSMLVRALWYIFLGWWLTGWAIVIGYLCALSIIGLPIAFWIFNRLPALLTLRPRNVSYAAQYVNGMTMLVEQHPAQYSMLARAAWFVFVGWWAGALWMGIAYLLTLTILGIPIGLMMFNRVGGVMTLLRY